MLTQAALIRGTPKIRAGLSRLSRDSALRRFGDFTPIRTLTGVLPRLSGVSRLECTEFAHKRRSLVAVTSTLFRPSAWHHVASRPAELLGPIAASLLTRIRFILYLPIFAFCLFLVYPFPPPIECSGAAGP